MFWYLSTIKYNIYKFIITTYFTVDVTVCHRGYHGDLNETFLIGSVCLNAEKLVSVTWECLEKAINAGNIIILCNIIHYLIFLNLLIICT